MTLYLVGTLVPTQTMHKIQKHYLLQLHATFRLRHSYFLGSSARGLIIMAINSNSCMFSYCNQLTIAYKK